MNNISIIGRTTKEAELRYTPQGTAVAIFSIAVNEGFGDKKKTYFFNVQAWEKTAENVSQYVRKGNKIGVSGSLRQDRWEDDSGKKCQKVYINASRVEFLESKPKENGSQQDDGWGE